MPENKTETNSKNTLLIFIAFTIISFSMHYFQDLSILKYTFKPFEVFFHEIGHGFTALVFGGDIANIHLEYNQGSVTSLVNPTYAPFVSFMGYFSASLFGFALYASTLYHNKLINFVKILLVIMSAYWFIHADGLVTILILAAIMGTFVASWYLKKFGSYLLRFISVYIMVSSVYSPTYLFAYSDTGDHVSLANQVLIPSFVWVGIWFAVGIASLWFSLKISFKHESKNNVIKK
jgi:hypothetical protein